MKTIFITGSEGFIGSHLLEYLVKQNYNVRGLVHYNSFNNWGWLETLSKKILDNVEIIPGDIRDPFFLDKKIKGSDCVINLAALIGIPYSYHAPKSYFDTNVFGLLNILNSCINNSVDLIHTSTSEVYGTAKYTPIDENHPLQAQSPYSASKIAGDNLVMSYFNTYGLPIKILRPFNTYGPRQSLRAVIPNIITQLATNKKQKIINIGSTKPTRDFTYIDDTVEAFSKAIKNKKIIGKTVNLGTGYEISISDLTNLIAKLMSEEKFKVTSKTNRIRPAKSEVLRLISNNNLAKKLLNWEPEMNDIKGLQKGLKKTINWYLKDNNRKYFKEKIYNE